MSEVGDAYVRIRPKGDRFKADTKKLLGGMNLGGIVKTSAAATAGVIGVTGAVAGLSAAIKGIVLGGAAFETELNTFQVAAGASADQMERARQRAKELGKDVRLPAVSAADAAVALTELAKGGLNVDQALAGVEGTLQLATAANVDFGTAAAITAQNLNAFGLGGEAASHGADLLAGASIAATGEVTDMAIALQQSAAVARQVGLTMDDTVAAIAELAKNGLLGSDAGTSLRTMLLRLVPQTKKAAEAMAEIGLKTIDAQGNLLPLATIFDNLKDSLSGLTKAAQQQKLNTIFGQDAIRAASIFARGGAEAFTAMEKAVSREGSAAELAGARTKGLAGSFGALQSNLETVALSIGERINPSIKVFVDSLNDGVTWVTNNWPKIEETISPTVERIAAVVRENWPQIRTTIIDALKDSWDAIQSFVEIVTVLWDRFGGTITEVVKVAFQNVIRIVKTVSTEVRDALKIFTSVLHGDWSAAWDALKDIVKTAISNAWETAKASLQVFRSIGTEIIRLIADGVVAAAKGLELVTLRVIESVLKQLGRIPTQFKIPGTDKTIGPRNPADRALDSIRGVIEGIKNARLEAGIADAFADNTANALAAKTRDITAAYEAPIVEATTAAVETVTPKVTPVAKTTGKKIGKAVGDGFEAGITDGAENSIRSLQKRLRDAIKDTAEKVKDAMGAAQQNLSSVGNGLAEALAKVVDEGPLGKQLKRLQDQLAGTEARTQSKELRKAITDATKDLTEAQESVVTGGGKLTKQQSSELVAFLRPKREAVRDAKAAWVKFQKDTVVAGLSEKIETDKAAVQKRLDTIVTQFNTGKIDNKTFTKRIATLVAGQAKAFRIAGMTLGDSFTNGFNAQVEGLLTQSGLIQKARDKGIRPNLGAATGTEAVNPLKVLGDQLAVQRDIRNELRITRKQAETAAVKRAQANAKKTANAKKKAAAAGGGVADLSAISETS